MTNKQNEHLVVADDSLSVVDESLLTEISGGDGSEDVNATDYHDDELGVDGDWGEEVSDTWDEEEDEDWGDDEGDWTDDEEDGGDWC